MIYLTYFIFPGMEKEIEYIWRNQEAFYFSHYPFKVLSSRGLKRLDFENITFLYGGNGSGKSTALNIIAEKIKLNRDSIYNKSRFYPDYVNMCETDILNDIPENSRIITSDDVFDYMLDIRNLNEGIDHKRKDVNKEYLDAKYSDFRLNSIEDYETLKKVNKTRSVTQTQYRKSVLMDNVFEYSNGENAFRYFTEKIGENGLFVLDEPENSLSPKRQLELTHVIEDSVRFFGCQFIISTHSPFLLAIKGAKIYNLDENPVKTRRWTELENVRTYRDFFISKDSEFK